MGIAFSEYVAITSGVGGSGGVRSRDLIGRIFTTNPLVAPGVVLEFTTAAAVGTYFGTTSEEYLRALFYFGWVSKLITAAQKISFGRWVNAAVAPTIYGGAPNSTLTALQAVTAGGFTLNAGGSPAVYTALDLSAAANLAAVATALQTKIRTNAGAQYATATVTYDATRGAFNLVLGVTGAATLTVTDGAQTPLALLKWTAATGAVIGAGAAIETVTSTLAASFAISDNFGSFLFMPVLSLSQVQEAMTWNAAQNVQFIYCQRVLAVDSVTWGTAALGFAGTALTEVSGVAGDYMEMAPMIIEAATPYETRRNVSQNYMFQVFPTMPVEVTDTTRSRALNDVRVNYNGLTQENGQNIVFYQRGVLGGGPTDPVDMNVFANESWLKDKAGTQLMSLLLALGKVSANSTGRSQIIAQLVAGVIGTTKKVGTALYNGVISVGKTLTVTQIQYVTSITGDADAWRQVQTLGYWLDVVIAPYTTNDGRTEYQATYTLVYAKDDTIRKVVGSHVLV